MDSHKKFNSNAISEDSPSYFKCQYVDIIKSPAHVFGKKIFQVTGLKNILTPTSEKLSQSAIKIQQPVDQDLDSLKLSLQQDITKGYKNTLRFQSNHFKTFLEKIEHSGFNRLTTEITSVSEMPKIVRTLKADSVSRKKQKSLSLEKVIEYEKEKKGETMMMIEASGREKKKLLKNDMEVGRENEIEEFEKKLEQFSFERRRNVKELYHTRQKYSI